jgi:hypothetical protein
MGKDVMRMVLTDLGADGVYGDGDDTVLYSHKYSDGDGDWRAYSSAGLRAITSLGNVVRMSFISVSAAGGDATVGNFLDGVSLSFAGGYSVTVPEPGTLGLLMPAFAVLVLMRRQVM